MKIKNVLPPDWSNRIRTSRRPHENRFSYRNHSKKEPKIITTEVYKEYGENIEQLEISKVIATEQSQSSYDK